MSALGSSVINKSNKKFAPKKAPIRRPGVPDSAEHSARPSEERQAQSQTPQLPSTLYPASPSPAPSRALLTSSRPDDALASHSVQAASAQDGNAIHLPLPSRLTSASREPSHSSIVPQKRPLARENHVTRPTSSYTKNSASADHPRPSTPTTHDALVRTNLQLTAKTAPSIERVTRSRRKETSRPSERIANNGPPTLHTRVSKRRKANEQRGERDETETGTARVDITTSSSEGLQNDSPAVATSTLPTKATSSSKLKRAPRKKSQKSAGSTSHNRLSAQALEDDENANEHQVAEPANQMKTQKRQKPKLSRRQKAIQDAAADIVEDAVRGTARTSKKGKTGHRRRPSTPDNAENVTIAPEEMKMIELCQDSHTGRKSLREQELREMDRAAFVKQKQRELQDMMGHAASPENDGFAAPSRDQETRQERQRGQERQVALNVPNTVIIDGQIQIDEDSLRIDRHAAAAVERDLEDLPPIDENDLSRKVTAGSFLKRDKGGGWNETLLDRFYQGLRMFGTDFDLISRMFPGKTRHAIKRKFVKEERLDYPRIKATLLGKKVPVVLEEYEKMTGAEYEDPAELDKIMEDDRKQLEEEQAAEKAAMEEAERQREEVAAAERAAAAEDNSGHESGGKGKKRKGKKGKRKERGQDGARLRRSRKKKDIGLGGDGFLMGVEDPVSRAVTQATAQN